MIHESFDQIAARESVGAASVEESRALADHVSGCADCAARRDEYRKAAREARSPIDPLAGELSAPNGGSDATGTSSAPLTSLASPRPFIDPRWYATAAILFLALWGWREMGIRVEREQVRTERAVAARLEEEKRILSNDNRRMLAQIQELTAPGTRTILLAGQKGAPSASGRFVIDPDGRRAMVFVHDMPPNPADRSYELWIVRADANAPEGAGLFRRRSADASLVDGHRKLPAGGAIKAVTVTLEPKGGVSAPTTSDYYLMGQAGP